MKSDNTFDKQYTVGEAIVFASLAISIIVGVGMLSVFLEVYRYVSLLLISCLFLSLCFPLYLASTKKLVFSHYDKIAVGISLFFSILNGIFHHVTLWGGYDSGVYSFFAMHIAKKGSIFIPFRGYPFYAGFMEVAPHTYTAQFLPGYSVFLSYFYKIGGLEGLFWANSLLLFFALLVLYLVGKILSSPKVGLIFTVLFSLHYNTLGFARETLSENLMILLIWLTFLLFLDGIERKNGDYIIASFIPLSLGLVVRFELLLYLIVFITVTVILWILNNKHRKYHLQFSEKAIFASIFVMLNFSILCLYLYLTRSRYCLMYLRAMWIKISSLITSFFSSSSGVATSYPTYENYTLRYVFDCFNAYLIIPLLAFIVIGLKYKKYNFKFLQLVLLSSPAFLLIKYPTISWVHPWFMRHYHVVLIPLLFLATSMGIDSVKSSKLKIGCIFLVITLFLATWAPLLVFAEEKYMRKRLDKIHRAIGDTNAALVVALQDHEIAEPLHFVYGYRTISSNYEDLDTERVLQELENESDIFVISSKSDLNLENKYEILPNFRLFSDEELRMITAVREPTMILRRIIAADRYTRPELIPPKPLHQGYAPIQRTIGELPPTDIQVVDKVLYVYKVEK
ncbi:MAG: hypothetical protein QME57_03365 [Patescibacteria group bacterium]|nr:hypothetical protein [Patescibacteria group bacterium]MDI6821531.1 hypothetical protein [Actinomycetota bacterium]